MTIIGDILGAFMVLCVVAFSLAFVILCTTYVVQIGQGLYRFVHPRESVNMVLHRDNIARLEAEVLDSAQESELNLH